MVNLEPQDYQQLVALLQGVELMQDSRSRRQIMKTPPLDRVLPLLDLEGPAFTVSANIVSFLANYGHLTYDNEALGVFLNTIKSFVGLEQQDTLARLMTKYKMMVPIAPNPPVPNWQNPTTGATVVEKVFGENTLRPISFLSRGLFVSRSVLYIQVQSGDEAWSGTGFMIAPGLAITNHHVIGSSTELAGAIVKFNYQETFDGHDEPTEVFQTKAGGVFWTDEELDCTVFEVEGDPTGKWGYLPLQSCDVKQGERVNIIQHPNGQPKQISLQHNLVEYVGGTVVQYVTATNPGSSGSPVLNDQWQVVGLHHAGGNIQEPTTGQFYNRNEGILIASILAGIPADLRTRLDQATQSVPSPSPA